MIDLLSQDEQRYLMELLVAMAKADGDVGDIEEEVLEQYADLVDIDLEALDNNLTIEELAARFTSAESRVAVLQEILRISRLDGYFADEEKKTILRVAQVMGIPVSFVLKVDEWVVSGLRWVWDGEELLAEAESILS